MNINQLHLFISVVQAGSFSKAEDKEYISKQAILKQINSLEEELQCTLLNRSSAGITLTEQGNTFLEGIVPILSEIDELVSKVQGLKKYDNTLRISSVEHQVLLSNVTKEFAKRHPEVTIQNVIHPNHSGEYRVENDIQDVGETIRVNSDITLKTEYQKLIDLPYVVVTNKKHPLAKCSTVSLSDLKQYQVSYYSLMTPQKYQEQLKEAFKETNNLQELNDVDNQVEHIYNCASDTTLLITANPFVYQIKEVVCIPLKEEWVQEYGIIYKDPYNPIVKAYVELAKELFTQTPNLK